MLGEIQTDMEIFHETKDATVSCNCNIKVLQRKRTAHQLSHYLYASKSPVVILVISFCVSLMISCSREAGDKQ
jgi:hypothetical protein